MDTHRHLRTLIMQSRTATTFMTFSTSMTSTSDTMKRSVRPVLNQVLARTATSARMLRIHKSPMSGRRSAPLSRPIRRQSTSYSASMLAMEWFVRDNRSFSVTKLRRINSTNCTMLKLLCASLQRKPATSILFHSLPAAAKHMTR